jgi:hypothetical protein
MAKKRKLNSKNPKYHVKDKNKQVEKKRVLSCIAPHGVKVYSIWYE